MTNTVRIKRRAAGGAAGAPGSLANAELAFNEQDDVLYYGKGTGGANGTATTVEAIAGRGAYVDKTTAQTIAGVKTFSDSPVVPTPATGDNSTKAATTAFVKAQGYLTDNAVDSVNGKTGDVVLTTSDVAEGTNLYHTTARAAAAAPVQSVAGRTGAVTLGVADVSGAAPLASPALTGTPTAPTPATANNSTQLATTAYVQAVVSALIDAAPGALDTLNELAAAIGDDPNFASTITNGLAEKLAKASNLSDLTNVATARTNLGLGSMATQNANNVSITGGSIDGITFDGGTF